MTDSTRDEIAALVRDHIDSKMQYMTSSVDYTNTDNLYDVCGLDDLDILEILIHMEGHLSIEMPEQDYVTVNDFVDAAEHL